MSHIQSSVRIVDQLLLASPSAKRHKMSTAIDPPSLADLLYKSIEGTISKLLIVDCRCFLDYNDSHIRSAVNAFYSKLVRRRLQENKIGPLDLLQQLTSCGLNEDEVQVVLYDQQTFDDQSCAQPIQPSKCAPNGQNLTGCRNRRRRTSGNGKQQSTLLETGNTFLGVLMDKMNQSAKFHRVMMLKVVDTKTIVKTVLSKKRRLEFSPDQNFCNGGPGLKRRLQVAENMRDRTHLLIVIPESKETGCQEQSGFLDFQARYPELCEGASLGSPEGMPAARTAQSRLSLTSLSQPCLPVTNIGPTKILPFLYLGSQQDSMDQQLLYKHGIKYVVNLSMSCPRPDFLSESNFIRIPVNDSYQDKLLPHFEEAFSFLDKVREANSSVLIHCLAGISRSPTLAIAYIMRHLHMSSEEAYTYVKTKRPSISPNFNFMGQLLEFEKQQKAYRCREVAEQLRSSMRKVLVTPAVAPTSPKKSPLPLADDPAIAACSDSEIQQPLPDTLMRRSLSCPVKMKKSASSTELSGRAAWIELDTRRQSPSSEMNSNGKRTMCDQPSNTEVEMKDASSNVTPCPFPAPPTWPSNVERPRGLVGLKSRRALNIPQILKEDLPSPSTELSKLSFKSGLEDKPLSLSFGGTRSSQTENIPPLFADIVPSGEHSSAICEQVQKDIEPVEPATPAPSTATVTATNPFFAGFSSRTGDSPTAPTTISCFKGCDLTSACSVDRTAPNSAQSPIPCPFPAPVVIAQPTSSIDSPPMSAENPFFHSSPPHKFKLLGTYGSKIRTAVKKPSVESPKVEQPPEKRRGGLSQKLAQFLRRTPLPQQSMALFSSSSVYGGYFVKDQIVRPSTSGTQKQKEIVRSSTGERLGSQKLDSPTSPPPKSKSESAMLHSLCADLDSPESGFAESPTIDPPYGRDPERESISSASSIEITVN